MYHERRDVKSGRMCVSKSIYGNIYRVSACEYILKYIGADGNELEDGIKAHTLSKAKRERAYYGAGIREHLRGLSVDSRPISANLGG